MWQEKEFQTFLLFGLRHFFNTSLKKEIPNVLDSITNNPLSINTELNLEAKTKQKSIDLKQNVC